MDIWGRTWQAEGTADSHEYVEIVKTVGLRIIYVIIRASLVAQMVKNLRAMQTKV